MSNEQEPPTHEDSAEQHARILDIKPTKDGNVRFTIDETATSSDLWATFAYLQPDKKKVGSYLDSILERGINGKKGNVMSNRRFRIEDPVNCPTSQAEIERTVIFGENPTIDDIKKAFIAIYGDEKATRHTRLLTLALVDLGAFTGMEILATPHNEIAGATDAQIADEMARLTDEF